MAVQKHRKTRAKRDTRRAHDALTGPTLSADPETGTRHRRHHIAADGYYRGRKIFDIRQPEEEAQDLED